jgi:hypothetical protein
MYKQSKKTLLSDGIRDQLAIDENHLMEVDSVEWGKEIDRVTKVLDDFNEKLERTKLGDINLGNYFCFPYNKFSLERRTQSIRYTKEKLVIVQRACSKTQED